MAAGGIFCGGKGGGRSLWLVSVDTFRRVTGNREVRPCDLEFKFPEAFEFSGGETHVVIRSQESKVRSFITKMVQA